MPFAIAPDEALGRPPARGPTTFLFAGGFLVRSASRSGAVVDAFVAGAGPDTRLVVKTQRADPPGRPGRPRDRSKRCAPTTTPPPTSRCPRPLEARDPRITTITDDLDSAAHHDLVSAADVLIGVSRWEGLGLHLYEAEPSGKLVLVNDMEPYTSFAADPRQHRVDAPAT